MNTPAQDHLLCAIEDGVARVTLNRPERMNALSPEMVEGMNEVFPRLEQDPAVRVVVITGAGDHFLAGGDVKGFHERLSLTSAERRILFEGIVHRLHPAVICLRRMPKPVLASVRGACVGFGMSLMMACDLAVAAEGSFFMMGYCNIGASPDGGGTYALPRIVGVRKAMELALLGDRIEPSEALRLGLVNRLVPDAELVDATAKLARKLVRGPTAAYGRTKQLLNESLDRPLAAQLAAEAVGIAECAAGPEFAEGVTAFVEKRRASFRPG
ncbi:MAG: enoyl-CoA hydratase [Deltaproteobacteria bacterium]|nr:enoyl-CoA hydratase [Deltaproteobacteria bacterium]